MMSSRVVPYPPQGSLSIVRWSTPTPLRKTSCTGVACYTPPSSAEAVNQYLENGSQVFVKHELCRDASNGSQNPRIWQGKDQAGNPIRHRASYESEFATRRRPAPSGS
jgi:hypothetical protein